MGGACGTCGTEIKCIQYFGGNTWGLDRGWYKMDPDEIWWRIIYSGSWWNTVELCEPDLSGSGFVAVADSYEYANDTSHFVTCSISWMVEKLSSSQKVIGSIALIRYLLYVKWILYNWTDLPTQLILFSRYKHFIWTLLLLFFIILFYLLVFFIIII
jgi:hypothetical protein